MIDFFPLLKRGFQKVVTTFQNLTVTGDATVAGDLTVNGTVQTVDVQTVESENDFILMRYNNPLGLADNEDSGFNIQNYDGNGTNLIFGVDNQGWARIGDENTDLQRIATIETPTVNKILKYNTTKKTLEAISGNITDIWTGTQEEYNAIATKDETIIYIIIS